MPKKILFFVESLRSGGKERRLLELLFYLKEHTNYEMRLILTDPNIHYPYVEELNIPIDIIQRCFFKKDPFLFFRFYHIAQQFKPDIIHTWGSMSTFYAIPAKIILKSPLLSNLIADAEKNFGKWSLSNLFFRVNCRFSDIILGNSEAGFNAYGIKSNKKRLIYNGVRLSRFEINTNRKNILETMGIQTQYMIIMVASTNKNKDYDFFLDVAKETNKIRSDITFVGVGSGTELLRLKKRIDSEKIMNICLLGKRYDIENTIAAADIGVLFSPCEGLSNAIIEYMALGKPVITTETNGGSREIIENGISGYIIKKDTLKVTEKINDLLNNALLRQQMGNKGKEIIKAKFAIEKMGKEFEKIYDNYSSQKT